MKINKELKRFAKGSRVENTMTGKYCVVYTRVSSKEQTENHSLEWQKKYCVEYANKNNLSILGFFGGTYESAKNDERKEFNRMMRQLKMYKEPVAYILVYSLDRFSRSGENAIYIASELKKKGIHVVSVTQPVDVYSSAGSFQQNIQFILSKFDNDQRRQKSVDGMREKLRRGEWVGAVPTGYSYDRTHGTKQQVIVINQTGKLIRKAFYWKMEGVKNPEIVERLKAQGAKIPVQLLTDIFRNPFYCGILSHGHLQGELVKGKHSAIVPEDVFLRVNKLNGVDGYRQNKDNEELPLKPMLRCAHCGGLLTGYIVVKKNLYYYKCNKKSCCNNRSAKEMHSKFVKLLSKISLDRKLIEPSLKALTYTYQNLTERSTDTMKVLTTRFNEVNEKLNNVIERFAVGDIDRSIYDKVAVKLDLEKREIEKEIEKTGITLSNPTELLEFATSLSSKLSSTWTSSNFRQKQNLQKLIFPRGLQYDRKKDDYRTDGMNRVFSVIADISTDSEENKNGNNSKNLNYSRSVPETGLEPVQYCYHRILSPVIVVFIGF
jgi:site-specific DNA recombinase